jgi:uncharacterized integral membrane protein
VVAHPRNQSQRASRSAIGARATIGLIVVATVLALSVLLIVQNFQTIEVQLFRAHLKIRLGWALVVAAIFGAGLSVVLGQLFRRR